MLVVASRHRSLDEPKSMGPSTLYIHSCIIAHFITSHVIGVMIDVMKHTCGMYLPTHETHLVHYYYDLN